MSNQNVFGEMRGRDKRPLPSLNGVSFMEMNFRSSETIWMLCQQGLIDRQLHSDIILVQDPPFSFCVGKMFSGASG